MKRAAARLYALPFVGATVSGFLQHFNALRTHGMPVILGTSRLSMLSAAR